MTRADKNLGVRRRAAPIAPVQAAPVAVGVAARLRAACNGHPHAKVPWPHYVLHEGADTIDALVAVLRAAMPMISDHAAGGRRLTRAVDASAAWEQMRDALAKATAPVDAAEEQGERSEHAQNPNAEGT